MGIFSFLRSKKLSGKRKLVLTYKVGNETKIKTKVINPLEIITFGRDKHNILCVQSPFVSRKHGTFQFTAEGLVYEDNSTNGTSLVRKKKKYFIRNEKKQIFAGDTLIVTAIIKKKMMDSDVQIKIM